MANCSLKEPPVPHELRVAVSFPGTFIGKTVNDRAQSCARKYVVEAQLYKIEMQLRSSQRRESKDFLQSDPFNKCFAP